MGLPQQRGISGAQAFQPEPISLDYGFGKLKGHRVSALGLGPLPPAWPVDSKSSFYFGSRVVALFGLVIPRRGLLEGKT